MSEIGDKVRSIAAPRKLGESERVVREVPGSKVVEMKHWDGRQDATVTPDPVRLDVRVHRMGRKKGQVAEVKRRER